ncbi:hypothetical protein L227DRAFT_209864 [Lentinus tigrinus ALCF2SS1-6]|uniref:Uncharacterized protein n=1 Tax=Lentinus tigrinus ALCF2SS1-6 TaxID=1328759 RepID=A0A5C2SNN5_9APHY|nr:hypothetical protein L227DRAFT_209864 [Lentinus tigrinus ALCF2SS1-6]
MHNMQVMVAQVHRASRRRRKHRRGGTSRMASTRRNEQNGQHTLSVATECAGRAKAWYGGVVCPELALGPDVSPPVFEGVAMSSRLLVGGGSIPLPIHAMRMTRSHHKLQIPCPKHSRLPFPTSAATGVWGGSRDTWSVARVVKCLVLCSDSYASAVSVHVPLRLSQPAHHRELDPSTFLGSPCVYLEESKVPPQRRTFAPFIVLDITST